MASIHRKKESPFWYAAWRGQGGRLFFRSTKQTDRAKAKTIALQYERAAKLAMAGELTEQQARKVLNDILEQTNTGEHLRAPSIKNWLNEWLAAKEATKAAGTGQRYRGVIEAFISHLGERANRPLSVLTPRDVQTFMTKRADAGCAPATLQVEGKVLRTALNLARRHGLVSINAAEAVELPARQSVERGTFSAAEIKLLVDAATGDWKTCIMIGYFTGARLSECVAVRWEDLDMAQGSIVFPKTKTGKVHCTPLHPDLLSHLERLASSDNPGFVMPKLASVRPSGRRGLSEQFKRIVEQAGLSTDLVKGSGKRMVSRRSFHALRHSFTSALANAGVTPEIRMRLTGHKSAEVHKGYTHHEMARLKEAVAKVPSLNAPVVSKTEKE